MKRFVLGLAVLAVACFGLSTTGVAENWHNSRRDICPPAERPGCGFGTHTVCTADGWTCMEDARQMREDAQSSGYGHPSHESTTACLANGFANCMGGLRAECHNGQWICTTR